MRGMARLGICCLMSEKFNFFPFEKFNFWKKLNFWVF